MTRRSACWPASTYVAGPLHRTERDLTCTPSAHQAAITWARTWCTDRALRPATATAVASVVDEAVAYGFRFGPQRVSLSMGWLDINRFEIGLLWRGCAARAQEADPDGRSLCRSIQLFDSVSERWGLETNGAEAWHWFTLDTRLPVVSAH